MSKRNIAKVSVPSALHAELMRYNESSSILNKRKSLDEIF